MSGQLDLPLLQATGAFSSSGALGGTEGSQQPPSPWACAGRGCRDCPHHRAGPQRTKVQWLLSSVWDMT